MENLVTPSFWKDKRVFLTGHTGFKGSWLSLWLTYMGASVFGYALTPPTNPSLFEVLKLKDMLAKNIIADIRNANSLLESLQQAEPEIIIHMAAQPLVRDSYNFPVETYMTNVMGTINLLEATRKISSVRSVVIITTDKCYENKEWHWGYRENEALGGYDPYSSSKACAELATASWRNSFFNPNGYGKTHSVAIATARAGNVIGGGDWAKDRLVPDCIRSLSNNETIIIRNPNAIRPWQHVFEPISGYLLLAQKLYENGTNFSEAWNFGPEASDERRVEWIVKQICSEWSKNNYGYKVEIDPTALHEATHLKLDCSKAREHLGWLPRWNLQTALKNTVSWSKTYQSGHDMFSYSVNQIEDFLKVEC